MKNKGRRIALTPDGFSLIEVLIVVAIMSVAGMAFTTMMTNQNREFRGASENLAAVDLHNALLQSLADGSVCQYLVNNPTVLTFNADKVSPNTPQILTPSLPIYASVKPGPTPLLGPVLAQTNTQVSAYSPTAWIKSIQLAITGAPSPVPTGTNVPFTGTWLVTLDPSKLVRALPALSVTTNLTVDTTSHANAKIVNCSSPGAKTCTTYYTNQKKTPQTYFSATAIAYCNSGDTYVSGTAAGCASGTGPIGSMVGTVMTSGAIDVGYRTVCYVGGWNPGAFGYVSATAQVTCCK